MPEARLTLRSSKAYAASGRDGEPDRGGGFGLGRQPSFPSSVVIEIGAAWRGELRSGLPRLARSKFPSRTSRPQPFPYWIWKVCPLHARNNALRSNLGLWV